MNLAYIPLIVTWLIILFFVLNHWISYDETPSTVLIVFLAALSLVPLAQRLKIGNLIDFSRKLNGLSNELNTTKQDIGHLSSQVSTLSTQIQNITSQTQQQIFANLPPDPETVRVFAETLLQQKSRKPDPDNLQETLTHDLMGVIHINVPTLPSQVQTFDPEIEDKLRKGVRDAVRNKLQNVHFLSSADEILSAAAVALRAYYAYSYSLVEGKSSIDAKVLPKPLAPLIDSMRELCSRENIPNLIICDKIVPHLDALDRLLQLRNAVSHGGETPPDPESIRPLFEEATRAVGFLEGALATLLDVLGLNILQLKKGSIILPTRTLSSDETSD